MRIGVPVETVAGERRVALVPEGVARLAKRGVQVAVAAGAGQRAGFLDEAFRAAGAEIVTQDEALGAEIVLKVQRPVDEEEIGRLRAGGLVAALLQPAADAPYLQALAARGVTTLALERVPRITRAQSMDVLSSQATVAGYKAVLLGAAALPRMLPMLTTAAGTLAPANAFVIGAGVAGLQAIATARRLGAVVSAFDVRPAVREQVQSLGAKFVEAKVTAEGTGGYARALDADQNRRALDAVHAHIRGVDLVITTAQIPGARAPLLVTDAMLRDMRPGSVVVDLAADTGGNCERTMPGQVIEMHGVTIIGATNLAATVPLHASQMLSRNLETLLGHLLQGAKGEAPRLVVSLEDEITGAMCVTHAGAVREGRPDAPLVAAATTATA
jgi:NAD(P) transhydrogenase subunit alpha